MNDSKNIKNKVKSWFLVVAIFLFTFFIFLMAPVGQVIDSKYSMLVTQCLINHGSLKLDSCKISKLKPYEIPGISHAGYPYQIEEVGNSLYYYYPPGSSLLSVPFVAVMNLIGVGVANQDGSYNLSGEVLIQRHLAALLMAALTVIFYFSARLLLSQKLSLIVCLGAALGTQIMSTTSRALWSDTWGIFILGIIVYLLLRQELLGKTVNPIALAALLSWTYFIKPTYTVSIGAISIFLLIYYRPLFYKFALIGVIWLSGFLAYSWYNFGKFLPNYYSSVISRFGFSAFWIALAGNLVSPSRGLLIFCPFVLFIFYLLFRYRRHIRPLRLLVLAIVICVLHLLSISSFPHWWGGHSYGPRLMTGILPWIILISVIAIAGMTAAWRDTIPGYNGQISILPITEKLKILTGSIFLAVSIFINVHGALFQQVLTWNVIPENVDSNPSRLWDWSYPQFLAAFVPAPYTPVKRLDFATKDIEQYLMGGWSGPELFFRWTDGNNAEVSFSATGINAGVLRMRFSPFLVPGKLNEQRVDILLNGRLLLTLFLTDPEPRVYVVNIPPGILMEKNVISFRCKDAASPKSYGVSQDSRKLGIAVYWFEMI